MYAQWTISKLVRWRVRDWMSCFLACRSPLDEKTDPHGNSVPELQIRNMVFEMKDDRKLSGQNLCRREMWANAKDGSTRTRSEDSSWVRSQDEEYIVFCFREDGAFDVLKDCKLEHLDSECNSPPLVNGKLIYGEVAATIRKNNHEPRSNPHGSDLCPANADNGNVGKVEEEESKCSHSSAQPETGDDQMEDIGIIMEALSAYSSDSIKSDSSMGSFSFPVLHLEFTGSPVQMPKPEDMYTRKQKVHCARFQCCRF